MTESPGAIAPFYDGWRLTNQRLLEAIGAFSPEQLAWRPGPHNWPIWATTAHVADAGTASRRSTS
ncbi:MAG TPA: DinB family protein [Candidatus Dormibacteraeota bacterium]|nr:DinB family protein [Candidatus Dormibacteraeota bacterium]